MNQMRRISINERQEQLLFSHLLNEEAIYMGDKEELVLDWLNSKFKPMDVQDVDELNLPRKGKAANVLDAWGQMTDTTKSLEDVFFILQSKFKHILSDKKERDDFFRECIKKWWHSK